MVAFDKSLLLWPSIIVRVRNFQGTNTNRGAVVAMETRQNPVDLLHVTSHPFHSRIIWLRIRTLIKVLIMECSYSGTHII